MRRKAIYLVVLLCALALAGNALAQGDNTQHLLDETDVPPRDPSELAERLGGVAGATGATGSPAPAYVPGDRLTFYVGNSDTDDMFEIEAELAVATPGVYVWVEVGIEYDAALLERVTRELDGEIFPRLRHLFGQESSPGIDHDPHIYILNATNLGSIGGYFNDASTYPREVIDTSNEHEMFVVAVDNIPFDSASYVNVLAHEFVHMIQHNEDPSEATWVIEGTAELGALLATQGRDHPYDLFLANLYFANPSVQLNGWDLDEPGPYYGAASLFFTYLVERFGEGIVLPHSREPSDGIVGVERTLQALNTIDPRTGEPVTFADLFADWVIANVVNNSRLGDGRFGYRMIGDSRRAAIAETYDAYPLALEGQRVNQFGPRYILLESDAERPLTVEFTGSESVRIVPTAPHSGEHFYWANRTNQGDARLTRAFDLSGVERATLHFWTWYEMEPFWDYGYLSVSTDNGQTWTVIETDSTTRENPNSRAFAAGITGYSGSGTGSRPAPYMGIQYDFSTGEVLDVLPGGGARQAGMQAGDRLLAADGVPFASTDLIALLNQYVVNDTVVFTVARGDQELDIPVTLGAHSERTLPPITTWIEETIDLTPFVGGDALVRFEYVTDQAFVRNGMVLDDISVPEIGYFDNAEHGTGGWTAEGWVRIANTLPQDFLVEAIQVGATMTISRWLQPGEGISGQWTLTASPDSPVVLVISGMTRYTRERATFALMVTAGE